MANYAAQINRTASATLPVGSLGAPAASMRRVKLYELVCGSEAVAADNPFLWTVQRCTALGTSSAVTPIALDSGDAACVAVVGKNHTVDATQTAGAIVLSIPLNQRATFRWISKPEGEIIIPATASNGVAFNTPTMSALAVTATVHFSE